MRFDDSLKTILAADMATDFGAQSAWRQLVDLMGRGRIAVDDAALARLEMLRSAVSSAVRAASARALAFAAPQAPLVTFFAQDELAIAAPVLRTACLSADDWLDILPILTPATRSVLRHRRDLPDAVVRGLQSFGPTDFALPRPHEDESVLPAALPPTLADLPSEKVKAPDATAETPFDIAMPASVANTPLSESPFIALGDVARGLPFVAEARRYADAAGSAASTETSAAEALDAGGHRRFEISDLVARIEAFKRDRTTETAIAAATVTRIETFRYETDAQGVIRLVEGVTRSALVGVSLGYAAMQGEAQLDGTVAGAFRSRSRFSDARLQVGGLSDAYGAWRISGVPVFDHQSGRFTGYRGSARRPRRDETAEVPPYVVQAASSPVSDSLRQLVHELRTPTNAIAGFAELIETQLLGPVSPIYRDRATTIRTQVTDLLAAIDDLDTAARIEGGALDLRPTKVSVRPLLDRIAQDLQPLADLRGAVVVIAAPERDCDIFGDDRAVERLIGRLLSALISAGRRGERIGVSVQRMPDTILLDFDRPASLAAHPTETLLSIDPELNEEGDGAPLLGTGFALRLARNLAVELGGNLAIGPDRLTLHLPAAVERELELAFDERR